MVFDTIGKLVAVAKVPDGELQNISGTCEGRWVELKDGKLGYRLSGDAVWPIHSNLTLYFSVGYKLVPDI